MSTTIVSPRGVVVNIWGTAYIRGADGQWRPLKLGEVVRAGDELLTDQNTIVQMTDGSGEVGRAVMEPVDSVDRAISALDAGTRDAAPAAGLAGGGEGDLQPGLRVERIVELVTPVGIAVTLEPGSVNFGTPLASNGAPELSIPAPVAAGSSTIAAAEQGGAVSLGLTTPTGSGPIVVTVTQVPVIGQIVTATGAVVGSGTVLAPSDIPGLRYVPPADYDGSTPVGSFTFNASNGTTSAIGGTQISLAAVNDAPVATPGAASGAEDTAIGVSLTGGDVDGTIATVQVGTLPAHGTLYLNDGVTAVVAGAALTPSQAAGLVFKPNADFNGNASLTFTVTDNSGAVSAPATFALTVTPVNDAPVAVNDSVSTVTTVPVTLPVLGNDRDVDGDVLRVTSAAVPADQGSITVNTDGSLTFTAAPGVTGTVVVTYTIADPSGATSSATLSVNVFGAPLITVDAPALTNDTTPLIVGTTNLPPGSNVTLVVTGSNGAVQTFGAVVQVDGTYSTSVPAALAEGGYSVVATGSVLGVSATASDGGNIDSVAPTVTVDAPALTNDSTPAITGTSDLPVGSTITLTVTDASGSVQSFTTTVQPGGIYTTSVPAPIAQGNYTVVATGVDAAGNLGSATDNGALDTTPPVATITLGPVTADNIINVGEAGGTIAITGIAGGDVKAGDTVTLIVNGHSYTGAVQAGGGFSIAVSGADLLADANRRIDASVTTTDAAGNSATQTAQQPYAVNLAPAAVADTASVSEDGPPVTGNVTPATTGQDSDPDGDPLTVTGVAAGAVPTSNGGVGAPIIGTWGALTLQADGHWTFTPSAAAQSLVTGQSVTDTFTYTISDGRGGSASTTLSIVVNGADDPTVISGALTGTVKEDAVAIANGTLIATDPDAGGASFLAQSGITGTYGTFAIAANGQWTYTLANGATNVQALAAGQSVNETFVVTTNTGASTSVVVTVTGTNDAPVASAAAFSVAEDAPIVNGSVTASDVDSGATLSFALNGTAPAGLVFNSNGSYTFDPSNAAYQSLGVGQSQILTVPYTVTDDQGATSSANLVITVTGTNDAPVAQAAAFSVAEDAPLVNGSVTATDVDANAALTFALNGAAPAGLVFNSNGSYTFDPSNAAYQSLGVGQSKVLTVPYTVTDDQGATSSANLTITVTGTNDVPTISGPLSGAVKEDTTLTSTGTLSISDPDAGQSVFVAQSSTAGTYGSFSITPAGVWTYTLNNAAANVQALSATASVTDSFTITSADGTTRSVVVTVTGTNDAPVASAAAFSVAEDAPIVNGSVTASDVDSGATLSFALNGTAPAGLVFNSNGSYTFDPSNAAYQSLGVGQSQILTVPYTVTDDQGATSSANLVITVTGTNDAPVAQAAAFSVAEDAPLVNGSVTATDVDANAALTFALNGAAPAGLVFNSNGSYTFDPSNAAYQSLGVGQSKVLTVPYTVTDDQGATSSANLTITVTGTNDVPTISGPLSGAVKEDTTLTSTGTLSISDPDAGQSVFVAQSSTAGTYGSFSITPAGVWTYTLNNAAANVQALSATASVTDSFTITSADGTTRSVVVTVTGTNDAPVASAAAFSVAEDAPIVNGSVTASDVDSGATLSFALNGTAPAGLVFNSNGSYTFDPSNAAYQSLGVGQSQILTVPYTVTDDQGATSSANLVITVTGTNDAPVAQAAAFSVAEDAPLVNGSVTATDVDANAALTFALNGAAPAGLVFNSNGSYTFDPSNAAYQSLGVGQSKVLTVPYTVTDDQGATSSANLTITVTGTNDVPTISGPLSGAVKEDTTLTSTGTLSISDPDAGQSVFVAQSSTAGTYGSFSITPAGVWTYTLNNAAANVQALSATASVTDSFTITSADGTTRSVVVTVTGTNDAPVASAAAFSVAEDAPIVNGSVTASDVDSGATLSFALNGTAPAGLVFNSNGSYTFDPSNAAYQSLGVGQSQILTVPYTVTDDQGATSSANLVITVTGTNDAPVAQAAAFSVAEDAPLVNGSVTATDVDANAALTFALNGAAPAGLVFNSNGSYTFDPSNAAYQSLGVGQSKVLTVPYTVTDDQGATSSANLTITVTGTNDVPTISGPLSGAVKEDTTLTSTGTLSISDPDAGQSVFVAQSSTAGTYGSFSITPAGVWTYTLNNAAANVQALSATASVTDSFTITSADGTTRSVVVTVTGTNDAPVASAAAFSVAEDAPIVNGSVTASDVDSGATLSFALNGTAPAGLVFNSNGSYTFDPSNAAYQSLGVGQSQILTVPYTVTDDQGATSSANLVITVTGTNDAPVAQAAAFSVAEDAPLVNGSVTATDVDANAALTFALNGAAPAGLVFNSNGSYTFDPSNAAYQSLGVGQSKVLTVPYTVTDDQGATSSANLTITVTGTNDVPTISGPLSGAVKEDTTLTSTGTLSISDPDAGQSVFVAQSSTAGTYGSFSITPAGVWTYTLNNAAANVQALSATASVTDSFTITSADGTTRSVVVTVTGTNDAPVASAAAFSVAEDAPIVNGSVTASDVDSGATLSFALNGTAPAGLVFNSNGSYTFDPSNAAYQSLGVGQSQILTVPYTVTDDQGATSSANLVITVTGTNDAPVAQAAAFSVAEDAPLVNGSVTATDVDANAALTFALNGAAPAGLVFNSNGSYTFDPSNAAYQSLGVGQSKVLTVPYTVTDDQGATSSANLTITVTGTNDAPVAVADIASTAINTTITGINVLGNDIDIDGDALTVTAAALANPAQGTVVINSDGTLSFTPALNVAGPVVINYTVSDPSGATNSTSLTVNVGANTPPAGTDATLTMLEDGSRSFTVADFGFSDPDPGQSFANVRIDSLPGSGALTLNGAAVTAGEVIAVADLGNLRFAPAPNANGAAYASFTFSVQDNAGGFDTTPNTLTFNVTPVPDPAVIGGQTSGATVEDVTTVATGVLTVTDPDAGEAAFQPQTNVAGAHGSFSNNAAGAWTYTLNNADPAVQALGAGQTLPAEAFTVTTIDGTTQVVTISINGTNDVATISGTSTAAVTEDTSVTAGNLTASGSLAVADVDLGQNSFATPATLAGSYGSFTFNTTTGAWTYTANNSQSAIQQLGAGQSLTDSIVVKSLDGTASQTISVTINGTNDTAVIGGTATGTVTEDVAVVGGNVSTSGTLTIADVDSGQAVFATPATLAGSYGSFTFNTTTGAWTYAASNSQSAIQQLGAGQSLTDSIVVKSLDGTASQTISVTINGTNDVATISGTSTAAVTEDTSVTAGNLTASGSLAVADVDLGQNSFATPATLAGSYGSFTFNTTTGAWTYTANNSQSAIQQLGAGQSLTDSIVVKSLDGTASQTISVTINGTNDTAVIGGTATGTVTEDVAVVGGNVSTSGTLTIADVDSGQAVFATPATLAGSYGSFTFNTTTGAWTYAASNSQSAIQQLGAGQSLTDSIVVKSLDGTASQTISVTINGTNDVATISGTSTAAVTEDTSVTAGNLTASGSLAVADVDLGQNSFATPATLAGSYGSFTFNTTTGAWTYTANNSQSAIQQLGAGQSLTDSIVVKSLDGTASQTISVTINGTNDTAVIGGTATGTVTEDVAVVGGNVSTSGTLTIADVDSGQAVFATPATLAGSYGSFTFNTTTGAWTYAASNSQSAIQQLGAGQSLTDSIVVKSLDGTASQTISVTINGTNDVATISGTSTAAVTEDTSVTAGNLTASGSLAVADVDLGQNSFATPATLAGSYGSFTFNTTTGAWTYTANNSQSAIQQLGAGQSLTDSIVVKSLDGTASQTISVTINGTNDTAVIGGTATGTVTEDVAVVGGNVSTSGTLTIADVDSGQAVFATPATLAGSYGSFTFNTTTGAWTYAASNSQSAIQQLGAGQSLTDSIVVKSLDGTASQTISVTINGTNDVATISGTSTAAVTEDTSVTAGNLTASGSLAVADVDLGQNSFATPATLAGSYGSFTFNTTTGAWTYTANNSQSAIQQLGAGQSLTDSIVVKSLDGTASQTISVTINGTNDTAVIGGTATGTVTEDVAVVGGNVSTSGTLTIADVDSGQAVFATPATLAGSYGSFTFNTTTGAWTYAASNSQSAIQQLGAGQSLTDSIVVKSLDGTASQTISVTINGTNDVATISGTSTAAVTEDTSVTAGNLTASGSLAVADVDLGQNSFATPATLAGSYGSFTFNTTTGAWTYTANNSQSAIQQLGAGQSLTDSIVVKSLDGTASQTISVTINGTNDTAVIGGTATGTVTEDVAVVGGNVSTSGTLTIADVDSGQAVFATPATLAGSYGSFTFNTTTGAWTYAASNSQSAIQQLGAGQSLTDSIVVKSLDGTASQTISVTINGTNDVATISGTSTAAVTEDTSVTAGNLTASGSLAVADVDLGQNSFATPATLAGSYGSFTFNTTTGAWTYTANNSQSAIQQLGAGQSLTDSIVVKSLDGTASQTISVTINGTNDTAVIGGTATGTVTEDVAVVGGNVSTSGTLTIADVDSGQAVFATPATLAGSYGSFTFNTTTGAWTYAASNSQSAIQQLGAGQSLTDSIVVKSLDGTASQTISVTINGTNDVATISGTSTAAVTEDTSVTAGNLTASGSLAVADVDLGQNSFATPATLAGSYGSFTFNTTTGAWTYTANNSQSAIQQLGAGQSLTDSIVVKSLDGTASQTISVTINGTNDTAVIGGTATGTVTEDVAVVGGNVSTSGTLTIADVDSGQAVFATPATLAGSYGSFTFNTTTGAWTYAASNSQSAIQQLGAGQSLTDSIVVKSLDGTASQTISVTINGTNDVATISGTSTAAVTEDTSVTAGNLTASGSLAVADVDLGQNSFATPATLAGSYGSFTFNTTTGAWTYTANNSQSAIQQLGAGQSLTDSIVVKSLDGTASQTISVTINGTNDTAVIGGTATGTVTEDVAVVGGNVSTSGTLTIADVDSGQAVFATPATLAGSYGSFTFNTTTGAWTYAASNSQSAIQQLGAGQSLTDSIVVKSLDGTASQTISVTINGTNDVATISGTSTAAVTEDTSVTAGNLTASGSLAVADVDLGQNSFATPATLAGSYGSFTFNTTTGAWTYTANNSQSAIQQLGAGQSLTDSIVVKSLDGTASQTISVTINGTNDTAVIGGTATGTVTEDVAVVGGNVSTSGTLTIADVDSGQAVFATPATLAGSYGSFTFNTTTGAWTYAASNSQSAIQQLGAGQSLTDSIVVKSLDGTASQTISVTINGTNDVATISGTSTAAVTEDTSVTAGNLTASGSLAVADVDLGQNSFATPATLAGSYGSFTFNTTTGAWTYTANNSQSAIQQLGAGQSLTDSIVVKSLDGTASQTISVTINGTNDTAVIGGTATGTVTEDVAVVGGNVSTSGTLTIADVDSGQAVFATPATLAGSYGSFTFNTTTGAWTYAASNSQSAIQQLGAGQSLTDSIVVKSLDGTASQTISVTINGTNDVATISGTSTAAVTEDTSVTAGNLTASGSLAVADVDLGQNSFATPATLAGSYGSFTFNTTTGAWTYTANNSQSAIQQLGAGQSLTDSIVVKSLDGTASQTISVTINGTNDAPVAVADARSITENATLTTTAATGVLANDTDIDTGDTKAVSAVAFGATAGSVGSPLNGTYGTLTLNADGSYSYSANRPAADALAAGQVATESFSYTMRDAAGATSTTSLTFTLTGTNDAPTVANASANVSEQGLPGGLPDANGTPTDTTNSPTASGTIAVADVDSSIASVTLTAPTAALTSGGQAVVWSGAGTQTLTGTANGQTVATLTIDNSGAYNFTLLKPVDHTAPGANDVLPLNFGVVASDGTSTGTGTLKINVEDDKPAAVSPITETLAIQSTNLMVVLDVSGSMSTTDGVNGTTRLASAVQSINNLLDSYAQVGDVKVRLITFSTNAQAQGNVWTDIATAKSQLAALTAGGGTNYDEALGDAITAFNNSGKLAGGQNVSYFFSDGLPTYGSGTTNQLVPAGQSPGSPTPNGNGFDQSGADVGIQPAEEAIWTNFLTTNAISSFAFGFGSGVTDVTYLNPIAYDGQTGSNTDASLVARFDDLDNALAATLPARTASGQLTGGSIGSAFGADGGYVKSIVIDGTTYTYNPSGSGSITASGGTNHGTFDTATHSLTVTTNAGGSFVVALDSATYVYNRPTSGVTSSTVETMNYTLTDKDGDTTSSSVTATFQPINTIYGTGSDETITGTAAPDVILAGSGNDVVNGGAGNDAIYGQAGNDTLNGEAGNDLLNGGAGNDVLNGGSGNDILIGGAGNDTLTGGDGVDTFMWQLYDRGTPGAPAKDVITDFNPAAGGDVIDLRGLLVGENQVGGSGNLQNYLEFDTTSVPGSTIIHVSSTGGFAGGVFNAAVEDQTITLSGVNLRSALPGLTPTSTDNDVIAKLVSLGELVTDGRATSASINDLTINEAAGTATFTVSLSNPTDLTVTVGYNTSNGTATAGSDYTATSGTLTFAAGVTSQTVTVAITNDTQFEVAETFNVNLTSVTNATISDNLGVGTIRDDGTGIGGTDNDAPTLAVSSVSVAENVASGYAVFAVSLSKASPVTTTVDLAAVPGTASSADFNASGMQVSTDGGVTWTTGTSATFAANQTGNVSVRVPIVNDTLNEATETFSLVATTRAGAGYTLNPSATGTGSITNDDPVPTLAVNSVTVNEGAGTATFAVSLSTASGQTVTVGYNTSNGTAIAGSDYTAATGTLTFAPGVTTQTITVPITDDTLNEANETFNVNLVTPTNATIANALGVGTIIDNDPQPAVAINDVVVNEAAGTAAFTVSLSAASGQNVTVNYNTSDGTAIAGTHYTAASGVLTFAPGSTTQTVTVNITNDNLYEGPHTFNVNLASAINATIADNQGVGTIRDDGTGAGGTNDDRPTLSVNSFNVAENVTGGYAVFNVALSKVSGVATAVDFTTATGTASSSDFNAAGMQVSTDGGVTWVSGTSAVFAPGQTSNVEVRLPIVNDALYETSETFSLIASNSTGATVNVTATGVATITNDDTAPTLAVSPAYAAENAGYEVFDVTLSAPSGLATTVNLATANGAAKSGTDFTTAVEVSNDGGSTWTAGTSATFAEGSTSVLVRVPVISDAVAEADETFTLTATRVTAGATSNNSASGTGTITESLTIAGSAGNDVISGGTGNESITGNSGNDRIYGGAGNDTIDGGAGNDIIYGGAGNDALTGGLGADTFAWKLADKGTGGTPAVDTVSDFNAATPAAGGDVLDLRDLLQGETTSATLDRYLDFNVVGGNTEIRISSAGGFTNGTYTSGAEDERIVLSGVDIRSALGLAANAADAQIIAELLNRGKLVTDVPPGG